MKRFRCTIQGRLHDTGEADRGQKGRGASPYRCLLAGSGRMHISTNIFGAGASRRLQPPPPPRLESNETRHRETRQREYTTGNIPTDIRHRKHANGYKPTETCQRTHANGNTPTDTTASQTLHVHVQKHMQPHARPHAHTCTHTNTHANKHTRHCTRGGGRSSILITWPM